MQVKQFWKPQNMSLQVIMQMMVYYIVACSTWRKIKMWYNYFFLHILIYV